MSKPRVIDRIKRVIRHKTTEKYYAGNGQWVDNVDQAKDFSSLAEVYEETQKYGIHDCCVLILRFGSEEYDVQLSI